MDKQNEILLVEDSLTQAFKMQYFLEEWNYKVLIARTGKEAIDILGSKKPSLIISDIMMPEMDGYEMCGLIKENDKYNDIPVILLTSLSEPNDIIKALSVGADSYFIKPHDDESILKKIEYLLSNPIKKEKGINNEELEIVFNNKPYTITANSRQIFEMLISTYENVIRQNSRLTSAQIELEKLNTDLKNNVEALEKSQSELKKREEQLIHSEKLNAVGKLSASLAHEFNNPICGIKNVLENVAELPSDGALDGGVRKLVNFAVKECDRMAFLIRSLQDFNRPSSDETSLINAHNIIDDILMLSKKQFSERGIKVEKQYGANIPQIEAEPDQIKQVLFKIIENAEEAITKEEGAITITTEYEDSNIFIHIKDTGHGILPEHKASIFEPFFTTKPAVKCTGLGLSVCYGIIKKHGGDIRVNSQHGEGTTFTIILPTK